MKVFISWSGKRSKMVAQAFVNFLQETVQAAQPWISTDIDKGKRWDPELAKSLSEAKVGIICLTNDNLVEPWLLFEAGAVSAAIQPYVCTFLLDVKPEHVRPPLGSFQHTTFDKNDVFKMVETINSQLVGSSASPVDKQTLARLYEKTWPDLEKAIAKARDEKPGEISPKRNDSDMLSEILDIVRNVDRQLQPPPPFGFGMHKPGRGLTQTPTIPDSMEENSSAMSLGLTRPVPPKRTDVSSGNNLPLEKKK